MGKTSIAWADYTFNPWIGCSKVSDGCKNCYAEGLMDKRYKRVKWGDSGKRKMTTLSYWKKPFGWNQYAIKTGKERRVFCGSLCDIFEGNPQLYSIRKELYKLIYATPNLTWMLLTKRLGNVMMHVPVGWWNQFPRNVWIGTSIESEKYREERMTQLAAIPACVKFVSVEPILGPINFTKADAKVLDWVIVGGESGPNHREMNIEWAKDIKDWSVQNEVSFFFKQISGNKPGIKSGTEIDNYKEFPQI